MKTTEKPKEVKQSAYELFMHAKTNEAWTMISEKEENSWTDEFIEINKTDLDWTALSFNNSLPWSTAFIKQYEDKWDWHALSYIIADKQYFDRSEFDLLLKRYKDKLDWKVICQGTSLNNNHLTGYAEFICWDTLSSNSRFTWSENFVNAHMDKINWKIFTECLATFETPSVAQCAFRKKVLDLYDNKLDFEVLSENDNIDFTPEIIEKYKKRWDWGRLINNPAIVWDESMLKQYDKYISAISTEDVRVSYMWACLVEHAAELKFILASL